ncbi:MAG: tripartite tricarboxylate transporter TctB family protein [Mycobacterium sp.]|nr:tripartite tricarboxylate transporter TctB family protein [Mycobacterium sp.]
MSMQNPPQEAPLGASPPPAAADLTDRWEGLAWVLLGTVILGMSLSMDRLANQGVAFYGAPGLLPGLLGIVMILFGSAVALRRAPIPVSAEEAAQRRYRLQAGRLAAVLGLCLTYSFVLVGRGLFYRVFGFSLPFWLASAMLVVTAILVLQHPQRVESGRKLDARAIGFALLIGICAGVIASLVFERFFLVHLP